MLCLGGVVQSTGPNLDFRRYFQRSQWCRRFVHYRQLALRELRYCHTGSYNHVNGLLSSGFQNRAASQQKQRAQRQ